MADTLIPIALAGLAGAAVWTDLKTRRIPNALTLAGAALALALRASLGPDPLLDGILGLFLGLAVSLPLVLAGGLGGGDAKLLAAVGAFLGPGRLVVALLVMAVAGGLLALAFAIGKRELKQTIRQAGTLVLQLVGSGPRKPRRTLDTAGALTIPYALPIAAGALAGWFA